MHQETGERWNYLFTSVKWEGLTYLFMYLPVQPLRSNDYE